MLTNFFGGLGKSIRNIWHRVQDNFTWFSMTAMFGDAGSKAYYNNKQITHV
jgi:hypothetical protein